VKGALFTVQKALPLMNDGGSIILTGSVASAKGTPVFWVYGATKAAIRNFVRGRTELTSGGIYREQLDEVKRRADARRARPSAAPLPSVRWAAR
jgi:NADP-dependent 3-hydroxy acid dehydrogenase YdfG